MKLSTLVYVYVYTVINSEALLVMIITYMIAIIMCYVYAHSDIIYELIINPCSHNPSSMTLNTT